MGKGGKLLKRNFNPKVFNRLTVGPPKDHKPIPINLGPPGLAKSLAQGIHHVHMCQAESEDRHCHFSWKGHEFDLEKKCPCNPDVDKSNVEVDGKVFIVHKGRCF